MRTWAWILVLPLLGLYGLMPIEPVMQMALIAISIFLLVKGQTLLAYRASSTSVQKTNSFARATEKMNLARGGCVGIV